MNHQSLTTGALLAAFLAWGSACPAEDKDAPKAAKERKSASRQPAPQKSIGEATMTNDGAIVLDLRAEGKDGSVGDARFVYPRSHKQYAEILKHLGGLKPGEKKPVPPWPDKR